MLHLEIRYFLRLIRHALLIYLWLTAIARTEPLALVGVNVTNPQWRVEEDRKRILDELQFEPEHGHAERDHGEVVRGSLLVAGGDAAILLEAADQPLDLVALAVGGFVEIELAGLILAGGDHRLDPALSEAATGRRTGVAPVACCPAGTQARAASPWAWHHALVPESIQRKLRDCQEFRVERP